MNNVFLKYEHTNVINKPNDKIIYSSNTINCLNSCEFNDECLGVVLSNPLCEKNLPLQECIGMINDIDILGSQPENLYNNKCKFMTGMNNQNYIINNSITDTSYIKTKYSDMLNSNIDTSKLYYLKINDLYLSIDDKLGLLFLTTSSNLENAGLFKFNFDGNIIETKSNKCLQTNGEYIILTDCDNSIEEQKFIYENKYNSIRPIILSNKNKMFCLSTPQYDLNTNNDVQSKIDEKSNIDNRIVLEECVNSKLQNIQNFPIDDNIKIEINQLTQELLNENTNENTNENFSSLKKLEKKIENIDYCTNPVYKTIVFLILLGIIIYFIWFVSRKRYFEDNEYVD